MISVYDKEGKLVKVSLTKDEQRALARRNIEHIKHAKKKDVSDWQPTYYTKKKPRSQGQKQVRQKEKQR